MDRYDYRLPKINDRDHRALAFDIERILKDIRRGYKLPKVVSKPPSTYIRPTRPNNNRMINNPSRSNSETSDFRNNYLDDLEDDENITNSNLNDDSEYFYYSRKRRDPGDREYSKYNLSPDIRNPNRGRQKYGAISVGQADSALSYDLISVDKEYNSLKEKLLPPRVSAVSWVVADGSTGSIIAGQRETLRREVASITKVMTCYVVCKLIRDYKIDPKTTYLQVSHLAASMGGTSARLQYGDVLTIWDLMHGLMLPSGNDAAMCLAESFGTYIYMQSEEYKQKIKTDTRVKNGVKYFLDVMNQLAEELNMQGTRYENPHGLTCAANKSTAADIAKLAARAMKLDDFREIVNQKYYKCVIEQYDSSERDVIWENTNKLLDEGWEGVKTGITTAAGPCFTGYIKIENQPYLVVALGCDSVETRFSDCQKLVKWAHNKRRVGKINN